jgi:hypothetical protein
VYVILGGFIVGPPIVGLIRADAPFAFPGDLQMAIPLMLLGALGILALLPGVIKNRVDETVIDRTGIRYGGRSWTWDEIAWIGSSEHNRGGVWIAFGTKDKPQRVIRLVVGPGLSPGLSPAQFEQVMQRVRAWALVHAPHVTAELTRTSTDRKIGQRYAFVYFAIALGVLCFLVYLLASQKGRTALDDFRHPVLICVLFIAGTLFAAREGFRQLRKSNQPDLSK